MMIMPPHNFVSGGGRGVTVGVVFNLGLDVYLYFRLDAAAEPLLECAYSLSTASVSFLFGLWEQATIRMLSLFDLVLLL